MAELNEVLSTARVFTLVGDAVRDVLGLGPDERVDRDQSFVDLGFDSLAAVELGRRLHQATGIELPLTVGFDYPTPSALAGLLAKLMSGEKPEAGHKASTAPAPPATGDEDSDMVVAVVGIGCRLPGGVSDADGLWELLMAGRDGIGPVPAHRGWDLESHFSPNPDEPGTTYVRRGGFLSNALDFDATFFGISEREAQAMDPQQRLLLEVAWEALEDASLDPSSLRAEPVGVFVGLATHDYYGRLAGRVPPELEGWFGIGNAGSVASGRIAYTLGLQGPAITVDTACSSSLVCVHLACQSLRRGECRLALAGGATVFSSPELFVEFSRHRGLSPEGRCRSFAASADGTGWSEGAGFVILERLGEARSNGHPVLALIRGSASNHDGASNGLSAPSGLAQEQLIRAALADGGLEPEDVDAVEGHGTATTLGDPIELSALQSVFDGRQRDRPLYIGSLKSNLGHCQAAAGVAGLIKMVLALEHQRLPATLHVHAPTSKVQWQGSSLTLLTGPQEWPPNGRPRRAGVSAFGISGTNAHVILEEAPADLVEAAAERAPTDTVVPLVLTGRDEDLLHQDAERLAAHIERHPELAAADVARTMSGRHRLERRAIVVGRDSDELLAGLRAIASNRPHTAVTGRACSTLSVAVLFSGQGSQRLGMGERLTRELPAFARAFGEVCDALDARLERPLREILAAPAGDPDGALLDRTGWTQPALFAIEVGLYHAAWDAGLRPDLLVGHSIGELAAAHVAGVLSLQDASTLVTARARLMDALPAGGAMAAVLASEDEVRDALLGTGLVIAAVNAPRATVVSGDAGALDEACETWAARGWRSIPLRVSHAFHSPLMDPMLDELRRVAQQLTYHPPRIPIVSTTTGTIVSDELTSPDYWVDQVRQPVRFMDAVRTLRDAGTTVFVETGPGTTLTQLAESTLAGDAEPRFTSLLGSADDEMHAFVRALSALDVAGVPIRWRVLPAVAAGRPAHLPPSRFRHRRFHAEPVCRAGSAPGETHPVGLATEDVWVLHERVSLQDHPWLADHEAAGMPTVPGTMYLDLALELGRAAGTPVIEELVLYTPVTLDLEGSSELQLRAGPPDEHGRRTLDVHARSSAGEVDARPLWERVAGGRLTVPAADVLPSARIELPPRSGVAVDLKALYHHAEAGGLRYGPAFRLVRRAWQVHEEIVVELDDKQAARGRLIDPALLDCALHPLALAGASEGRVLIPFSWSAVRVHAAVLVPAFVRLRRVGEEALALEAFGRGGNPLLSIDAIHGRPLTDPTGVSASTRRRMFELTWEPLPVVESSAGGSFRAFAASASAWPAGNELLAAARASEDVVLRIEPVPDNDARRLAACTHALTLYVLRTLADWAADEAFSGRRLVFATRGAVAAAAGEVADPATAAVWGLVRTAQNEHPGRFWLLDEDGPEDNAAAARALARAEPQLAVRAGMFLRPALRRVASAWAPIRRTSPGTALITGGTRGLGALVARHLARQGAEHLLLVSRHGEAGAEPGLLDTLRELGARVTVAALDVAKAESVTRILELVPADAPLRTVVHAAGTVHDGLIGSLDDEAMHEVLRPKVDAVAHLDEQTRELDLDEFVMLSSLAGVVGAPGQGNYAAANAFLDALAQRRLAAGLPGLSLAFGVWEGRGMAGGLDTHQAARLGEPLSTESGLSLFDAGRGGDVAALVLAELDPQRLAALAEGGILPPVLRPLAAHRSGPYTGTGGNGIARTLADRLAAIPTEERTAEVLGLVVEAVAAVIGAGTVDLDSFFVDIGFDSLKGVELRNRLTSVTGLQLAPTLVFDRPTPRQVAALVLEQAVPTAPTDNGAERHLEHLALAISGKQLDDEHRVRIIQRLRELLDHLQGGDPGDGASLNAASDEEVFSYIESTLGITVD